MQIVVAIVVG